METKRIYDRKSYMNGLETVCNFYKTCLNTIEDCLKNNGEIEISDDEQSEWRFDLLGYDGTMIVEKLTIDHGGNFTMQCVNELDGLTYFIQWYELNNDIVIIKMIMDKVLSCTEPDTEEREWLWDADKVIEWISLHAELYGGFNKGKLDSMCEDLRKTMEEHNN